MISAAELQNAYIKFYEQMRKYIWMFATVELLAELEVAVYSSFPDIDNIRRLYNSLWPDIRSTSLEDEEFKKAADAFNELIQTSDTFYSKLDRVSEVVV